MRVHTICVDIYIYIYIYMQEGMYYIICVNFGMKSDGIIKDTHTYTITHKQEHH